MIRLAFILIIISSISAFSNSKFRIISLHPTITENLFALSLGHNIVGTTAFSDYPPEASRIPRIGDHSFSAEKIVALHPTHVISITERFGISRKLADSLNAKLIKVELERLEDFSISIRQLAEEFQAKEKADEILKAWSKKWQGLNFSKINKKILIQIQRNPLVVAGKHTFLDSILEKCGLENVMESTGYPTLNRETVVKLNPDIIALLLTGGESTNNDPVFQKFTVAVFDPNIISRITPRLAYETRRFCEALR